MKHVFIVNPAAGKTSSAEIIRERLREIGGGYDTEVYETKAPKDATEYVRARWTEAGDEPIRFYACGGDGTIFEVVNGLVGAPESVSFSCYPCGSGDDFVKYYGGRENFLDIQALMNAPEEEIDLLSVNGSVYSANIVNFGFDTTVAKTMIKVKRRKLIGGKRAYVTGVVTALIKAMKNKCKVTADGELLNPKGKILLCTLANCSYVGGSFYCAPRAINNDGLIDVALVTPISRFTFIKLLPVYTKGGHLDDPRFGKVITYRRAKTVQIEAPEGFSLTVDGEILDGTSFTVSVLPRAARIAVPRGAKLIGGRTGELFGEDKPAEEDQ